MFLNSSTPRSNKYERDWSRFNQENFIVCFQIDLDNLCLVSNINVDNLYRTFTEGLVLYIKLCSFEENPLKRIDV